MSTGQTPAHRCTPVCAQTPHRTRKIPHQDTPRRTTDFLWTPVATLRPNGSTVAIYYVHSDQLNAPREITRPIDSAQMWTWFSDPFGTDAANVNSSGAGSFPYNLRFPGQVFDGEAGLHANGFRDFDPAVGRYVESDPIGLAGGSYATYAYADGNPISESDPLGLDPWGGLGGGVSATEAQALSVVQAFNNWFNTPNPCFKAQLQAENPRLEPVISEFSLLDLTVGPWNTAPGGAVGGWVGYGFGTGSKVGVVNYLNYKRPGWGDTLAKWLKRGAFPVIAYSTYRHVQAAAGCGCKR